MKINDLFSILLSLLVFGGMIIGVAYPNFTRGDDDAALLYIALACVISVFIAKNIVNSKVKKILIAAICSVSILTILTFTLINISTFGLVTVISIAIISFISASFWYKFKQVGKKENTGERTDE